MYTYQKICVVYTIVGALIITCLACEMEEPHGHQEKYDPYFSSMGDKVAIVQSSSNTSLTVVS